MDDAEARKVVILLVRAIAATRKNAMAARMVIEAIKSMSAEERTALTPKQISSELANVERQLISQHEPGVVRIVEILEGQDDFLEPLRVSASQLHW